MWEAACIRQLFNQLSALQEDESQILMMAYGAGRWMTQKRIYASSNDENVHGVRTAYCHNIDK